MDQISMPARADNAENAVKCSICGNSILVGSENGRDRRTVVCDICRHEQEIEPRSVAGVSNEDY